MTDSTDIDVKIEADAPVDGNVTIPAEVAAAAITPEEGIEALKAKLAEANKRADDATAARTAAEARANDASRRVADAQNTVADTNVTMLTNAIDMVKAGIDTSKRAYADAMTAGDFALAADAQAEMSLNSSKLVQLETGLQALKNQPKATPERIIDPVEQLASQMPPRSAAWIRSHPEYATDPRLYQKMLGAHNVAVTDGYAPDSDDYFREVERVLKVNQATPIDDSVEVPLSGASTAVSERTPPAAPVSRGPNGQGSSPRTVRLSAAELEIAAMTGQSPEEYAKNKIILQAAGKMH